MMGGDERSTAWGCAPHWRRGAVLITVIGLRQVVSKFLGRQIGPMPCFSVGSILDLALPWRLTIPTGKLF